MMAGSKSLLSVFIIFSALSALLASTHAWSHRHGHVRPNLCQKCCSEGGPECESTKCQCPIATPKPASVCEDCCGGNPSRFECAFTDCDCSSITKPRPSCKTCCSDKIPKNSGCELVRCACRNLQPTTTTARPVGPCESCCGPRRAEDPRCKIIKCNCLLPTNAPITVKPRVGRCEICCDLTKRKKNPEVCKDILCNCLRQPGT